MNKVNRWILNHAMQISNILQLQSWPLTHWSWQTACRQPWCVYTGTTYHQFAKDYLNSKTGLTGFFVCAAGDPVFVLLHNRVWQKKILASRIAMKVSKKYTMQSVRFGFSFLLFYLRPVKCELWSSCYLCCGWFQTETGFLSILITVFI